MELGKGLIPLVVSTSSGMGGVSPPFSILPEKLAEQTEAIGQAVIKLMTVTVADPRAAVEVIGGRLEDAAQSLDQFYQESRRSASSINDALEETVRRNFENGLRFIEGLTAAKGPSEVINLQFRFLSSQMTIFAEQSKEWQRAFGGLYSAAAVSNRPSGPANANRRSDIR